MLDYYYFKSKSGDSYEDLVLGFIDGSDPHDAFIKQGESFDDFEEPVKDAHHDLIGDVSHRFDGDIIITDPCYLLAGMSDEKHEEIWNKVCDSISGERAIVDFGVYADLGMKPNMVGNTIYGDWGCSVFDAEYNKIGGFCADAGLWCVVPYDAAIKFNPALEGWIKSHSWCAAVIKDFHGDVHAVVQEGGVDPDDGDEYEPEIHLEGVSDGKTVFFTAQTSF